MESPLIVREQLGSLVIIIIFLPSKKNFVSRLIERLYSSSYRTSREMINYHPTSLTFDPLRSYWPFHKNSCYDYSSLTITEMAMKPLLDYRGQIGGLVGTLNKRIQ